MCLGSGIYIFLASKCVSCDGTKMHKELSETLLNKIIKNITTYVLLSSKLGLVAFGPTYFALQTRQLPRKRAKLGSVTPNFFHSWKFMCYVYFC